MTLWSLIRFLHVLAATLWVGGQLTVSLVVLPLARRRLDAEQRSALLRAIGGRFGRVTLAVLLPVQLVTGVAMAWHKGLTWESLLQPGYGRVLAAKLLLFGVVMAAAAAHGIASGRGHPALARVMAITSLGASVGVVLLATALPAT
ncbi:DUF2269 family protein [Salinactinospora qingdaonensis]|uniref:Copper resistance protein D n=1 Tax=Salinactinospora qingdaonensis TaxID=702744 RepID=A0ABP7FVC8_9ACTN